ncbi:MAG: YegS/Rv2252/BmrU family lipid kinase [Methyloceanibacter sp.]
MRRRFFILHNPNAGPAARRHYHSILTLLRDAGAHAELVETSRHGDAMKVAAEAALSENFDAIVAAGGDGTVHDAAEGVLGSATPLGIIPMGTANVFAREVGLPFSPERVASALLYGTARDIRVGQINTRPFLFVVGIGFDAEAVAHFEASGTRQLGQIGLLGPVIRALASHSEHALRVTTNAGSSEAQWIIVTRVKHYAGGLLLSRDADITGTQLYVVSFGGRGKLVRLRQLSALACGVVRYDPDVAIEPAEWVRVESDTPVTVQVDGELLGALPAMIKLHPQPLQLIFPANS